MSVNKVTLVGRLGAEPESRAFPDGGSVCNLRIATTESWKDRTTGERKERTEWHRCVLRNRLGEVAAQYLHKGDQVYLEGSIRTRKWQDQSGNDKFATEIAVQNMTMLGSRGGADSSESRQATTPQPASPSAGPDYGAPQGGADYLDDNIPF